MNGNVGIVLFESDNTLMYTYNDDTQPVKLGETGFYKVGDKELITITNFTANEDHNIISLTYRGPDDNEITLVNEDEISNLQLSLIPVTQTTAQTIYSNLQREQTTPSAQPPASPTAQPSAQPTAQSSAQPTGDLELFDKGGKLAYRVGSSANVNVNINKTRFVNTRDGHNVLINNYKADTDGIIEELTYTNTVTGASTKVDGYSNVADFLDTLEPVRKSMQDYGREALSVLTNALNVVSAKSEEIRNTEPLPEDLQEKPVQPASETVVKPFASAKQTKPEATVQPTSQPIASVKQGGLLSSLFVRKPKETKPKETKPPAALPTEEGRPTGVGITPPSKKPIGSAFVFVVKGNSLLFHIRSDGTFGVPGGMVEDGEDYKTAALRELGEEAQVRLNNEVTAADLVELATLPKMKIFLLRSDSVTVGGPRAGHEGEINMTWQPPTGVTAAAIPDTGHWWIEVKELLTKFDGLRVSDEMRTVIKRLYKIMQPAYVAPEDGVHSWVPQSWFDEKNKDCATPADCAIKRQVARNIGIADKVAKTERMSQVRGDALDKYIASAKRLETLQEDPVTNQAEIERLTDDMSKTYGDKTIMVHPPGTTDITYLTVRNPYVAMEDREKWIEDKGQLHAQNAAALEAIAPREMIADKMMAVALLESLYFCGSSLGDDPRCFPTRVLGELREYNAGARATKDAEAAKGVLETDRYWRPVADWLRASVPGRTVFPYYRYPDIPVPAEEEKEEEEDEAEEEPEATEEDVDVRPAPMATETTVGLTIGQQHERELINKLFSEGKISAEQKTILEKALQPKIRKPAVRKPMLAAPEQATTSLATVEQPVTTAPPVTTAEPVTTAPPEQAPTSLATASPATVEQSVTTAEPVTTATVGTETAVSEQPVASEQPTTSTVVPENITPAPTAS